MQRTGLFLAFSALFLCGCDIIPIVDPPATMNEVVDGTTVNITLESGRRIDARLAGVTLSGDESTGASNLEEQPLSSVGKERLEANRQEAISWLKDQLQKNDAVRIAFVPAGNRPARSIDDKPLLYLYDRVKNDSGTEQGPERMINRLLIEKGYALFTEHPQMSTEIKNQFEQAQARARNNQRGLWSEE